MNNYISTYTDAAGKAYTAMIARINERAGQHTIEAAGALAGRGQHDWIGGNHSKERDKRSNGEEMHLEFELSDEGW